MSASYPTRCHRCSYYLSPRHEHIERLGDNLYCPRCYAPNQIIFRRDQDHEDELRRDRELRTNALDSAIDAKGAGRG